MRFRSAVTEHETFRTKLKLEAENPGSSAHALERVTAETDVGSLSDFFQKPRFLFAIEKVRGMEWD